MNSYSQFKSSLEDVIAILIRLSCLAASAVLVWTSFQTAITLSGNVPPISGSSMTMVYITFQGIPLAASNYAQLYIFIIKLSLLLFFFLSARIVARFATY